METEDIEVCMWYMYCIRYSAGSAFPSDICANWFDLMGSGILV